LANLRDNDSKRNIAICPVGTLEECDTKLVAARYVANDGTVATHYPANPNGSPRGVAAPSNTDGRVTIVQMSWRPADWGECSPRQRLFDNGREWVG
jgi:phosphoribosylformylglycinamidine synthase